MILRSNDGTVTPRSNDRTGIRTETRRFEAADGSEREGQSCC